MNNNIINHYQIGDEIPNLITKPISRSMLALYAGASGDHNPIHIDIDFAKQTGLSDVIAPVSYTHLTLPTILLV